VACPASPADGGAGGGCDRHSGLRPWRAISCGAGLSEAGTDEATRLGSGVGFEDQRRLDEHYKARAEFGRISKQDYLHQAQLPRDAKVGDPILEAVRATV
jgi:hypothetical protein